MKHKSSIGIHLAGANIVYVEYNLATHAVVAAGETQNLYPGSVGYDAACKKTIQSIVTNSIDKKPLLVFSLPVKQAIIETLHLDKDEADVSSVIELELCLNIAGSAEDYVVDSMLLSGNAESENQHEYLAVGYNKRALNKLSSCVGSRYFSGAVIDLDAFALINAFSTAYPEYAASPCLIIDAGDTATTVVKTKNGNYIDSEVFSYIDSQTHVPHAYHDQLAACVTNMNSIGPERQSPDCVCYTGKLAGYGDVAEAIKDVYPAAFLCEPFRGSNCSTAVYESITSPKPTEFAVAMGLALRGGMEQ
jgi:Tfp pilus assembly PilM family ATPase